MKRRLVILLSFALLLTVFVLPAQAADQVINLISESGASWEAKDANNNSVSYSFTDGKLIATAPGAWPYVTATFNTPIVINQSDNAVVNIKFKVEDEDACVSIRLIAGTQAIYIHHFIDGATYDGSGDIDAGDYELSMKLSDLKAFAGTAEDQYLGKKDLVYDAGKIIFDKLQVWCAGSSSDITVTIEKFEIVIPGEETDESSEAEVSSSPDQSTVSEQQSTVSSNPTVSEQSSTPPVQTGDSGLAVLVIIALASLACAAVFVGRKRTQVK